MLLTSIALRHTSPRSASGNSASLGIGVPSSSTGMTRMLRASAAAISRRTKSRSSSSRVLPSGCGASQRAPISTSSASHWPTALRITSSKGRPGSMASTSMKMRSAVKRSVSSS